jgi:hypothetical protein
VKRDWKGIFRKWLRRMAWFGLILLFLLVMLEIFYRNQWVDTYRRELKALNPATWPSQPRKKLLVMGDSFSAAENSWVNLLRNRHPDYQIVNSSVPGTTIFQANLMLSGRLATFKPDLLIYQVYVGNDLFDLRYPLNWSNVSFFRNLYWASANRIRSLAWLNYALGQWKRTAALPDMVPEKDNAGQFDPQKYSPRERLYLEAEPTMIVDQALLRGPRAKDMVHYQEILGEFLKAAKAANCPVMLVVIPHCAQVSGQYAQRMTLLGAVGMDSQALQAEAYPFWTKIEADQGKETGGMLNLLPRLRALESSGIPAYYLHDTHLTDAGQAAVADAIEAALNPIP